MNHLRKVFSFPVGIQLFNRPEYANQLLESVRAQLFPVNVTKLHIYIDGYEGSLSEKRGENDNTETVESISRLYFPNANIVRFQKNQGIANLRNQLQHSVFAGEESWAAFFEEDLVLDLTYLEELSGLIEIVDPYDEVSKVACFQIIDSMTSLPRGFEGFYPGRGTQAVAERKSFFVSKQRILLEFIELTLSSLGAYDQFRNTEIASTLANDGIILTFAQHDSLEEQLLHSQGKLHVVTKPDLAKDIGLKGVHSYVTKPLDYSRGSVSESTESRRISFDNQLKMIRDESLMHSKAYFKNILDGFHISKSRKKMLLQILKLTLRS